jgi:hypothetical protein
MLNDYSLQGIIDDGLWVSILGYMIIVYFLMIIKGDMNQQQLEHLDHPVKKDKYSYYIIIYILILIFTGIILIYNFTIISDSIYYYYFNCIQLAIYSVLIPKHTQFINSCDHLERTCSLVIIFTIASILNIILNNFVIYLVIIEYKVLVLVIIILTKDRSFQYDIISYVFTIIFSGFLIVFNFVFCSINHSCLNKVLIPTSLDEWYFCINLITFAVYIYNFSYYVEFIDIHKISILCHIRDITTDSEIEELV